MNQQIAIRDYMAVSRLFCVPLSPGAKKHTTFAPTRPSLPEGNTYSVRGQVQFALPLHCVCIAFAMPLPCLCYASAMPSQYICIAFACPRIASAMPLLCLYVAFALQFRCPRIAVAMRTRCLCIRFALPSRCLRLWAVDKECVKNNVFLHIQLQKRGK